MAIKNRGVSIRNLTWMVKNDNLGLKTLATLSRFVLGIRAYVSSLDILNRNTLNVESNILTWVSLLKYLVMCLNRFYFSDNVRRTKLNSHSCFKNTSFNSTYWNGSYTRDLVNIL